MNQENVPKTKFSKILCSKIRKKNADLEATGAGRRKLSAALVSVDCGS